MLVHVYCFHKNQLVMILLCACNTFEGCMTSVSWTPGVFAFILTDVMYDEGLNPVRLLLTPVDNQLYKREKGHI